jgi:hypothetical protein
VRDEFSHKFVTVILLFSTGHFSKLF